MKDTKNMSKFTNEEQSSQRGGEQSMLQRRFGRDSGRRIKRYTLHDQVCQMAHHLLGLPTSKRRLQLSLHRARSRHFEFAEDDLLCGHISRLFQELTIDIKVLVRGKAFGQKLFAGCPRDLHDTVQVMVVVS